jgi:hypothetical protein
MIINYALRRNSCALKPACLSKKGDVREGNPGSWDVLLKNCYLEVENNKCGKRNDRRLQKSI